MRTLVEQVSNRSNILVGGHRGHESDTRENTIENFDEVKHLNISHLEVDIQLTKDNVAVVYHDIELSNKTNISGMIRDYTYQELKANFKIQTLDEVLNYCKLNDILLGLEIKTKHIIMHQDILKLVEIMNNSIKKYSFEEYCFVFSVDYRALNKIKKINDKINIGLIVPFIPVDPIKLMEENQAIIYLTFIENLSKDIVDILHLKGYFVDGSVINDVNKLNLAIDMNIDMIESDYPDLILNKL